MEPRRKNLVYFLVFTNPQRARWHADDYLEQLAICLASLRRTSDPTTFDVLFLADADKAEKIRALPELAGLTHEIREFTVPADLTVAMCTRFEVHARLGGALARYEKVLYVDIDIVFVRDVQRIFDAVNDPGRIHVKPDHWGGTNTDSKWFSLDVHSEEEAWRFAEEGVEVFNSGQFAFVNSPAMAQLFADLSAAVATLAPRSRLGFDQPIMNSFLRSRHLEQPCLEQRALDALCHLQTDEEARAPEAVLVHFIKANKVSRMRAEVGEPAPGQAKAPAPARWKGPATVTAPAPSPAPARVDPAVLQNAIEHHQKGRMKEAEEGFRRGLPADPHNTVARSGFGYLLFQTRRYQEGLGQLDQSLATNPRQPSAHAWRGLCLASLGRKEEALAAYKEAIRLDPRHMGAHNNAGQLLVDLRRGDEAIPYLQRGIELGYKRPEPHVLIARAHVMSIRLVEAEKAYREALQLDPNFGDARLGLSNVIHDLGDLDAAIPEVRRVIEARPQSLGAHSNLVMKLLYHDGTTPEQMAADHRAAGQAYMTACASGGDPAWQRRDADPGRRLRVGYLSPDFHMHACAFLIQPLLAAHDPAAVEVFCYSAASVRDAMTDRLRGLVHGWRDIEKLSARDAAARIAADRIDILVDCAGHTKDHRLSVMAMKPAPIQVTWLGYPHGTGLPTVDYRLTDALADPPGMTESHYVEELVRLPEGHFCYQPPPHTAPEPAPGPLERGEGPVFGCLNNPRKIGAETVRLWSSVVNALPGSRLTLRSQRFADRTVAERLRARFVAAGLAPDRVEIEGRPTFEEGFGLFATMDVALDPFPYHGTTSTCEALWMGVPVVTLPGRTCVSRVGASLLARVGLDDLVARDADHFRSIAVGLARDPARLADLRRTLRGRMARSPLGGGPVFARQFEDAYRTMWKRWCATASGA